jgi:Mn2+/Fe2+ NRAMP family transporter
MQRSTAAAPPARSMLLLVGPGMLLAATGVGGGDLATASFVGGMLGTAVLWAVPAGALLKFVVTEGLARWQIATGETLLEGAVKRLGPLVAWLFLPYLLLWSFYAAAAQMSANGVTLHAMLPVFADARDGKIAFGIVAGLVGLALVARGGFGLFERIMRVCIGVMFATVVTTAVLLWPGTAAVVEGLVVPRVPTDAAALTWVFALIGGVGGTLTVLCYGYWLREEGTDRPEHLAACRLDLALAYAMTAVFGIAMVIVGSHVRIEGEGTQLLVVLAARLGEELGPVGKWLFLFGTLGTVFSSLLGVWQATPYLFADCWRLLARGGGAVDTRAAPYRGYLVAMAVVPMLGLFFSFREMQKLYALAGACLFPALALTLLVFNGRKAWIGARYRNGVAATLALAAVLAFFTWLAFANVET